MGSLPVSHGFLGLAALDAVCYSVARFPRAWDEKTKEPSKTRKGTHDD